MLRDRYAKLGAIFLALLLLNVVVYFWENWGLITVKVTNVPLRKVVSSIEWQGWVKIYTNLPLDQKVTMYVDHVPLPEAMETLAEAVSGPANGAPDRADRPDRGNQAAGGPPPSGGQGGGGQAGGDGGGIRRGGGFGGGGFGGGGTSWNLAFFVAPTKALAEQEIAQFESGAALTNDDLKVYSYPTPLQMVMTDNQDAPIADPRKQVWPGYTPPAPPPPPAPAADGSAPPTPPADPPGPPTVQTYLQAFAQSSDIWIMAPGSWAAPAPTAPPATSSIIRAVKRFVSSSHGSVIQAYVLRGGLGGPRTRGGFSMEAMEDRMNNALNGLPPEDQEAARNQLVQEKLFYQSVQAAQPEQRPAMMQDHMQARMADHFGDRWRRSPEKRAQFYARIVANRQAATGK